MIEKDALVYFNLFYYLDTKEMNIIFKKLK